MPPKTRGSNGASASVTGTSIFEDLVFSFSSLAGKHAQASDVRKAITNGGGSLVASVTKKLTYFIAVPEDAENKSAKWKQASERSDVAIVSIDFVLESSKAGKLLSPSDYSVQSNEAEGEEPDEEAEDDEEEQKPAPKAGKLLSPSDYSVQSNEDEEAEDDEEEQKPAPKAQAPSKKRKVEDAVSDVDEPAKPAKIVKAFKKGSAVIDSECPQATSCHVLENKEGVWDAMLNQTEIKTNNNKFFVLQLLESDAGSSYYVWTRWGRVGARGQSKLDSCSKDGAIALYQSKFKDKTKNEWANRANFTKVPGKYFLIERDFGDDDADVLASKDGDPDIVIPDSKLPEEVQNFVKLIFNVDMMTKSMTEIGYDANKLPLGKLTKSNIKKGYDALTKISNEQNEAQPNKDRLIEYSSEFYTIIPHAFHGQQRPPVIDSPTLLKQKLMMVESLGDIVIATEILKATATNMGSNPVDMHYQKLKTDLVPVKQEDETFALVQKYMQNTHGETHGSYTLEIEDLFEVKREGEEDRAKNLHNRQLLWHGSRMTNYVGILSQGLKIAPPEAPVTGYMFGKGIYFADMVSKSANYCFTSRQSPTGILLLCEVALGDQWKSTNAEYEAKKKSEAAKCHSTFGQGRTTPDPSQFEKFPGDPDLLVPCGKGINSNVANAYLQYNELITYDIEKVKIRYLIRTRFKHRY